MNWFLVFVPVALALHYLLPEARTWTFISAGLGIIPLAGLLGKATERLATASGEGVGALLNATFGNAAELIISLAAIRAGLYDVVKASITGSIIGNILLVMGGAFLAGGMKHRIQRFNATAARAQATTLTLAAVGLIMPAMYHYAGGNHPGGREADLSMEIACVLLATYFLTLLFSLRTHRDLFKGKKGEGEPSEEPAGRHWTVPQTLAMMLGATLLIAWLSDVLVGSVEDAARSLGMTSIFVGVIVVAIIGNAAEHSMAILQARKNRMDLSYGIAIGSSIQIALLVAPLLVFASRVLGPLPMNLVFTPFEVVAITLAILIIEQTASDGESNWLEGVQLLSVYCILCLVFYFLPA
jgi:Ca2+:H+ antiporter